MIKLTDLMDTDKTKTGSWVQYKTTGFYVLIAYYGKQQMMDLAEKTKISEFDVRLMRDNEKLDNIAFRREFARAVIKGWKGLTLSILETLIPVKSDAEVPADYEFECTDEYKEFLIANSIEFDQWVQRTSADLNTFNAKKKEEQQKN